MTSFGACSQRYASRIAPSREHQRSQRGRIDTNRPCPGFRQATGARGTLRRPRSQNSLKKQNYTLTEMEPRRLKYLHVLKSRAPRAPRPSPRARAQTHGLCRHATSRPPLRAVARSIFTELRGPCTPRLQTGRCGSHALRRGRRGSEQGRRRGVHARASSRPSTRGPVLERTQFLN